MEAYLHDYETNCQFDVTNLERDYQLYLAGVLGKACNAAASCHTSTPATGTCAAPKSQEKICATKSNTQSCTATKSSLALEIENARGKIVKALNGPCAESTFANATGDAALVQRVKFLEEANANLLNTLRALAERVSALEKSSPNASPSKAAPTTSNAAAVPAKKKEADADDDFDLFGSDAEEDDAEAERVKAERLQAYEAKKSKKPVIIAKSNIILDVKPWDNETDMKELERLVRTVACDGLLWGSAKLVPIAYGIKKLQISCVVEDDKVGEDFLVEEITKFEDFCQSVDIAAFNKV